VKVDKDIMRLYAITDRRMHPDIPVSMQVEAAIKGGATIIQYREKELDDVHQYEEACRIQQVCAGYGIPLIINDNVELALRVGAAGVHLGQNDMGPVKARKLLGDNKIIGVTAKTVEQAVEAMKNGADYLGSGAVFGSTTKTDAVYMEKPVLEAICNSVNIPVVAIGGINAGNIEQLAGIPVAGYAIVGGIFGNDDIEEGTRRLLEIIKKM